jgi:hypothetical protein
MGGLPIPESLAGIPPYGRDMYSQPPTTYIQPHSASIHDQYEKLPLHQQAAPNSYDPILPPSAQTGVSFLSQLTGLNNFEKSLSGVAVEPSPSKNPKKEGYDPLALSGEVRVEGVQLPMARLSADEISKLNSEYLAQLVDHNEVQYLI